MLKRSKLPASVLLTAALALGTYSAQAADMYKTDGGLKDAPVYAPVNTWAGFYIGANGGYGWNSSDKSVTATTEWFFAERPQGQNPTFSQGIDREKFSKLSPEGGFGGGQLGYNFQRGNLVFGVEADGQGSDISDSFHNTITTGIGAVDVTSSSKLDWFGTLRGRFGYGFDRGLIYATAGFATGGVKSTFSANAANFPVGVGTGFKASYDETRAGYAVGGGIEYLLTPSWSFKAEYQYMDLGSAGVNGNVAGAFAIPGTPHNGLAAFNANIATNKFDYTYNTVRVGLNYHLHDVYEPLK